MATELEKGRNFRRLSGTFKDVYVYVDAPEHHADHLFINRKLRVQFKADFRKEGEKYQIVVCKVPKRRREDFVACMEELCRNMLVLGRTDYPDACDRIYAAL